MKITAGRREDLIRERDEYNAKREDSLQRQQEEERQYRQAQNDITQPVSDLIQNQLTRFGLHDVVVRTDPYGRYGIRGFSIRISVNEITKFDDTVALSWGYEVYLNSEGEPVKESSSWSGLKACTVEQMRDLQNTVTALSWLNSLDWTELLDKTMPKYRDYFHENVPEDRSKEFESQLLELEIEEAVGTNKLIQGDDFPSESSRGWRSRKYWYRIVKETPKKYVVEQYYSGQSDDEIREAMKSSRWTQQVSKEKFLTMIDKPIVWKEV